MKHDFYLSKYSFSTVWFLKTACSWCSTWWKGFEQVRFMFLLCNDSETPGCNTNFLLMSGTLGYLEWISGSLQLADQHNGSGSKRKNLQTAGFGLRFLLPNRGLLGTRYFWPIALSSINIMSTFPCGVYSLYMRRRWCETSATKVARTTNPTSTASP